MSNMALVDVDQLEAGMLSLANKIRAKSKTTGALEWPSGYEAAVDAINTQSIQSSSGVLTTNTSGYAFVNCGFKPDMVSLQLSGFEQNDVAAAIPFSDSNKTTLHIAMWVADGSGIFDLTASRNNSGFTVNLKLYDHEGKSSTPAVSMRYTARKFSG